MPENTPLFTLPCPIPFLKLGQRFIFQRTYGSADALMLAHYFSAYQAHQDLSLLTIVCANAADAQRLSVEIPYFVPNLRVRLFPDWKTLPYDTFSPHQDLISERLATLHDLNE